MGMRGWSPCSRLFIILTSLPRPAPPLPLAPSKNKHTEAKKAYNNPELREKAGKLLQEAKEKASDPAIQEKLKASVT